MQRLRHVTSRGRTGWLVLAAAILGLFAVLVPSAGLAQESSAPTSATPPQVLGSAVVGNTLTASSGTWSGSTTLRFTYRWLRCPANGGAANGSDCTLLPHTGSAFYRVRAGDRGSRLTVRVTAFGKEGRAQALSDTSDVVTAAGLQPVSLTPPKISGKTKVGSTLTAKPGLTAGARPIEYRYLWRRCNQIGAACVTITGANSQTYAPTKSDAGSKLRVRVFASNSAGSTWSASAPTAALAPATSATAPKPTGEPRILGTPVVGNTLTATNGSWSGSTPMTFTYQWRRCPKSGGASDASNCGVIPSATKSTYQVQSADVGLRLRVRVTATNADGSATSASNATDIVRAASSKPANTSPPTISGTTTVGQTLTASNGSWSGTQPISLSYQWRRCDENGGSCADISGATDRSYTLKGPDAANTLRVRVTARNSAGSTSSTSAPTAVVRQAAPAGPGGVINLPGGLRSIPVANVPKGERLLISEVHFVPNVVTSRSRPITIRVRIRDTRGFVVRGALVFARATPRVTTGEVRTSETDGWVALQLQPLGTFPLKRGAVQFFLRAYRSGDPLLAGISTRRLVQVLVR
jgi:large repetitive protein